MTKTFSLALLCAIMLTGSITGGTFAQTRTAARKPLFVYRVIEIKPAERSIVFPGDVNHKEFQVQFVQAFDQKRVGRAVRSKDESLLPLIMVGNSVVLSFPADLTDCEILTKTKHVAEVVQSIVKPQSRLHFEDAFFLQGDHYRLGKCGEAEFKGFFRTTLENTAMQFQKKVLESMIQQSALPIKQDPQPYQGGLKP